MALESKTAATDESTPPDKAHNTLPLPTFSLIALICSSTKESMRQSPAQLHTSKTKLESIVLPYSLCKTSGWNWIAYKSFSLSSQDATGQSFVCVVISKPGAIFEI